jgi:hypothetical protein
MPGYNKNWLWRGDELWFDRWQQLWSLSVVGADQWPGQPEYLQIISWNDYGESHYIGPLNDKAYVAFGPTTGKAPFNYALGMPHDGWRHLLPFMINMWKTGTASVTQEALVAWYRLTPGRACDAGGTSGNTAAQLQTEVTPWSLARDKVFFAALITSPHFPRVTIGGRTHVVSWTSGPDKSAGTVGIYYGSVDFEGATGDVLIELVDSSGTVVASLKGAPISATCPNGVQNWNAWVGSAVGNRAISPTSPKYPLSKQLCVEGSGSKSQFNLLCQYSCALGYCPPGPCTCYKMGVKNIDLDPKNIDGYPLPGSDCTYLGLCSFACNYGFCPSEYCTSDAGAKDKCVVPAPEPDPDDQTQSCTSGTGEGNLAGLCSFSCGRGFCPVPPCKCTGVGPRITPPPETDDPGYPRLGYGLEYKGLCDFACSRGYCPEGACSRSNPYGAISVPATGAGCNPKDPEDLWRCKEVTCPRGDLKDRVRWQAVGGNEFFNYTVKWFGAYNDFNPNPATGAQPFDGTPWENNPIEAIAYFFSGENDKGGTKVSARDLDCEILGEGGGCSDPQSFKCGTTDYAALDFLLTSFVNIHNFYNTMYQSLTDVQADLTLKIEEIAATFWQSDLSALAIFKAILGLFSLILTLGGSAMWSELFRIGSFNSISDAVPIDAISEAVGMFSTGFDYVSQQAEAHAVSQIQVETTLKAAAAEFFNQARQCLDTWMKRTFTGDWDSYERLFTHVKDGLFLSARSTSSYDFYQALSPVVTGMSIVETWKMESPLAIIYEQGDHAEPRFDLISSGAESHRVRVPDQDYTLWIVNTANCGGSGGDDCIGGAIKPTGIDELEKADNKWKLTKEDIALSSFYGYMLNRQSNPIRPMPSAKGMDASGSPFPYAEGLKTPGIFPIPVCDSELYKLNLVKDGLSKTHKCEYFPCCERRYYE